MDETTTEPAIPAPAIPTEQPAEQKTEAREPNIIERAEKIRDDIASSEKRIFEKIKEFETKLAEQVLSGRAELVPTKSQQEKDKEESEKIVKRFLG